MSSEFDKLFLEIKSKNVNLFNLCKTIIPLTEMESILKILILQLREFYKSN